MSRIGQQPCRICQTGQRISTVVFGVFACALSAAAADPDETPARQLILALCAAMSGLAVFRFPIARMVQWRLVRRRHARLKQKLNLWKLQP